MARRRKRIRTSAQVRFDETIKNGTGVPTKYTMFLPAIGSQQLKLLGGLKNNGDIDHEVNWSMEIVLGFLFHPRYSPKTFQTALAFMDFLMKHNEVDSELRNKWLRENQEFSQSTLERRVLPKLRRFGLIKITRELPVGGRRKVNERPMILVPDIRFATLLKKVGSEWAKIIKTKRQERLRNEKKGIRFSDEKNWMGLELHQIRPKPSDPELEGISLVP